MANTSNNDPINNQTPVQGQVPPTPNDGDPITTPTDPDLQISLGQGGSDDGVPIQYIDPAPPPANLGQQTTNNSTISPQKPANVEPGVVGQPPAGNPPVKDQTPPSSQLNAPDPLAPMQNTVQPQSTQTQPQPTSTPAQTQPTSTPAQPQPTSTPAQTQQTSPQSLSTQPQQSSPQSIPQQATPQPLSTQPQQASTQPTQPIPNQQQPNTSSSQTQEPQVAPQSATPIDSSIPQQTNNQIPQTSNNQQNQSDPQEPYKVPNPNQDTTNDDTVDPYLTVKIHPEDLDMRWTSWKCLNCDYVYEGVKPINKCPRCGNDDPDKFD